MSANIFIELNKYTSSPENSLTEAFVFLLNFLLERDKTKAINVINGLSGFCAMPNAESTCVIETQFSHEEGRPDIVLKIDNETLIHVEVKHDAQLGDKQLERYYEFLRRQSDYAKTKLILLSRSKNLPHLTSLTADKYHSVGWYEIESRLMKDFSLERVHNEVTAYILESFSDFLALKGMVMKKISWEFIEGTPALYNLGIMMEESLREVLPGTPLRRTCGWEWRGFYTPDNFFFGIYYSDPSTLVFAENKDYEADYRPILDLDQKLFFAMTAERQFQLMIDFVKDSYSKRPTTSTTEIPSLSDEDATEVVEDI